MNAIEINNITKNYKGFSLSDVTFNVPMGCIVGLVGENGAGKSTTIKLILGMTLADSGEINIFGNSNKVNLEKIKEDLGVVLDEAYFPECINVSQVNKIMTNTYLNWNEQTFFGFVEKFSLPLKKQFKDFSRGMKMKLSLAVALSHNAKLLILDEATSGLDPIVRDEILDIFYDFISDGNHSILISSHIVSDLEKLCDYVAFIHKGKLVLFEEKDLLTLKYGVLKCSNAELEGVPKSAIKGKRINSFGVEALVERGNIPSNYTLEKAGLEDVILYLAKGGEM